MPAVYFIVEFPDGAKRNCYSPSSVIHQFFKTGEQLTMSEFLQRSRRGLHEASERVHAKFGFHCSSAQDQLASIEEWGQAFRPEEVVTICEVTD